jgi:pyruvate formate lyase activating enzyme
MIAGLQKMTLLDYPGKVACTVFLQGCNYACPFCHNSGLLPFEGEPFMEEDALIAFLEKRRGILDGVCITGGEPTLYSGLEALLRRIKALGYAVKLDTNGSNPKLLRHLAEENLLDYVAMDVKNCPSRYGQTVGMPGVKLAAVEESLRFLIGGGVPYELRTTLVQQFHDEAAIAQMGQWLCSLVADKKPAALYLQRFVDRESVAFSGLSAPETSQIEAFSKLLTPFVQKVLIRGQ